MVKNKQWPRHAINSFVLAKLEAKGISPTNDAAPEMLIRRVYFDLIGLPPTAAEVSSFVTQNTSWQQVVDELLESPHFSKSVDPGST